MLNGPSRGHFWVRAAPVSLCLLSSHHCHVHRVPGSHLVCLSWASSPGMNDPWALVLEYILGTFFWMFTKGISYPPRCPHSDEWHRGTATDPCDRASRILYYAQRWGDACYTVASRRGGAGESEDTRAGDPVKSRYCSWSLKTESLFLGGGRDGGGLWCQLIGHGPPQYGE